MNTPRQKITEQILLHLSNSMTFGFSYTFKKKMGISDIQTKGWNNIYKKDFNPIIRNLCKSKYIVKKEKGDMMTISLSDKGKLKVLNIQFKNLKNKKGKWDNKWRLVSYDMPEKFRKGRNALRNKLKKAGFHELQKSVFVLPYDCKKEIMLLVELFELKKYVRFGILEQVDNSDDLKKLFQL